MKDYYCIRFIIDLMAGITFQKGVKFQMENQACGAIIMHAKRRCIFNELSTTNHTIHFSTFNEPGATRYFQIVHSHHYNKTMEYRRSCKKFLCCRRERNYSL